MRPVTTALSLAIFLVLIAAPAPSLAQQAFPTFTLDVEMVLDAGYQFDRPYSVDVIPKKDRYDSGETVRLVAHEDTFGNISFVRWESLGVSDSAVEVVVSSDTSITAIYHENFRLEAVRWYTNENGREPEEFAPTDFVADVSILPITHASTVWLRFSQPTDTLTVREHVWVEEVGVRDDGNPPLRFDAESARYWLWYKNETQLKIELAHRNSDMTLASDQRLSLHFGEGIRSAKGTSLENPGTQGARTEWLYTPDLNAHRVIRYPFDATPNPASGHFDINYLVTTAGPATITLYDLRGRTVNVLLDWFVPIGDHVLKWHTEGLRPGLYLLRFVQSGYDATIPLHIR